jgi:hypothetical protein
VATGVLERRLAAAAALQGSGDGYLRTPERSQP